MPSQPNLLLITSDQQRWDAMSFHGTPGYRTPALDRLAAEGMCFPNAYCASPICTPTRVSLLTGQWPSRHGAFTIGTPHVPALDGPTLPRLLGEAGYATAIVGKTHFVARNRERNHVAGNVYAAGDDPPPDESFFDSFDGPYVGFDFVRHAAPHTSDRRPDGHYRAWLKARGIDADPYHHPGHGRKAANIPDEGRWGIPLEAHQNEWITSESEAWIQSQQDARRPWFCWASYQDPHPPYVCPDPWFSDVDMTDVDVGGWIEGDFADKPSFYQRFRQGVYWSDEDRPFYESGGNVPAAGEYTRVADPKTAIRAYIGMCNMLDAYVGRLVERLDALGARENTLVLFTADHGDYLGRHGFWQKGLPAYDDAQRVPFLANWPAAMTNAPKGRRGALTCSVDVPRTFLAAAGAAPALGMQGVDLTPVLTGRAGAARDWALVELEPTEEVMQHTFICERHKLVIYRDADYGELYDLAADPDQRRNLWSLPRCAHLRQRLLHRLARADMQRQGVHVPRVSHA